MPGKLQHVCLHEVIARTQGHFALISHLTTPGRARGSKRRSAVRAGRAVTLDLVNAVNYTASRALRRTLLFILAKHNESLHPAERALSLVPEIQSWIKAVNLPMMMLKMVPQKR